MVKCPRLRHPSYILSTYTAVVLSVLGTLNTTYLPTQIPSFAQSYILTYILTCVCPAVGYLIVISNLTSPYLNSWSRFENLLFLWPFPPFPMLGQNPFEPYITSFCWLYLPSVYETWIPSATSVATCHLDDAHRSHLDCCNNLLPLSSPFMPSSPNRLVWQKILARLIFQKLKFNHVTPLLKWLQWLPHSFGIKPDILQQWTRP